MHQFFYTNCREGTRYADRGRGMGVLSTSDSRLLPEASYLRYPLERVASDGSDSPRRFALLDLGSGARVLLCSSSVVGWDLRRTHFAHVVYDFSPAEMPPWLAVESYWSDFWILDTPGGVSRSLATPLAEDVTRHASSPSPSQIASKEVASVAAQLIAGWLSSEPNTRIFVNVHPDVLMQTLRLFCSCVPKCLLADLTFSNFEESPAMAAARVVGIWKNSMQGLGRKDQVVIDPLLEQNSSSRRGFAWEYADCVVSKYALGQATIVDRFISIIDEATSGVSTSNLAKSLSFWWLAYDAPAGLTELQVEECLRSELGRKFIADSPAGVDRFWAHLLDATRLHTEASSHALLPLLESVIDRAIDHGARVAVSGDTSAMDDLLNRLFPALESVLGDPAGFVDRICHCSLSNEEKSMPWQSAIYIVDWLLNKGAWAKLPQESKAVLLSPRDKLQLIAAIQRDVPASDLPNPVFQQLSQLYREQKVWHQLVKKPEVLVRFFMWLMQGSEQQGKAVLDSILVDENIDVHSLYDQLEKQFPECQLPDAFLLRIVELSAEVPARRGYLHRDKVQVFLESRSDVSSCVLQQLLIADDVSVLQSSWFVRIVESGDTLKEAWIDQPQQDPRLAALFLTVYWDLLSEKCSSLLNATRQEYVQRIFEACTMTKVQVELFRHGWEKSQHVPSTFPSTFSSEALWQMLQIVMQVPERLDAAWDLLVRGLDKLHPEDDDIGTRINKYCRGNLAFTCVREMWLMLRLSSHYKTRHFYDIAFHWCDGVQLELRSLSDGTLTVCEIKNDGFTFNGLATAVLWEDILQPDQARRALILRAVLPNVNLCCGAGSLTHLTSLWSFLNCEFSQPVADDWGRSLSNARLAIEFFNTLNRQTAGDSQEFPVRYWTQRVIYTAVALANRSAIERAGLVSINWTAFVDDLDRVLSVVESSNQSHRQASDQSNRHQTLVQEVSNIGAGQQGVVPLGALVAIIRKRVQIGLQLNQPRQSGDYVLKEAIEKFSRGFSSQFENSRSGQWRDAFCEFLRFTSEWTPQELDYFFETYSSVLSKRDSIPRSVPKNKLGWSFWK